MLQIVGLLVGIVSGSGLASPLQAWMKEQFRPAPRTIYQPYDLRDLEEKRSVDASDRKRK
ncbi:hypothetical protein [Rhizobium sp. BG4]|uniref:hypothetical protein n=1 Tax=Rhizobium sp. BG4 TaxID=2613770 RepID=UPI00193C9131|nr:hypothetical protein [Rhizobium sp. BG4]QRM45341.1 hypothetical protein F2982_18985 [Rhizobium sp. BG4]